MADALLTVENLTKSFGDKLLFEDISFGINVGQKTALIARNGYGKSTLLNILTGKELQDSGKVTFRGDVKMAYLPQRPDFHAHQTVRSFVEAAEKPENIEPWDFEQSVKEVLSRLEVDRLMDRAMDTLSGGEQKKVALSRILIDDTNLLLLDEPTNHLDISMIEWLEEFLSKQRLAILMVTHDRYFLDNVCQDILELDNSRLYSYKWNRGDNDMHKASPYNYFVEKKAERQYNERAEVEKAKSLYRTELDWMRRMPQARGTKARARIDAFYELEQKAHTRFEEDKQQLSVKTERIGGKILEMYNVCYCVNDSMHECLSADAPATQAFTHSNTHTLINDFSYTFKKGEKIGIVGPNGIGKSTFLNILTQQLRPDSGRVIVGQTIQFGLYSQSGLQAKDDQRVIDIIRDVAEVIELENGKEMSAHQFLSYFGFDDMTQYNYFGNLSGGERRKLYLLTVLMANPNFLILDEPTNDLDIYTLGILEQFLIGYKGCLIIVSHDRSFMDNIVDHLFVFEGEGRIRDYHSNYTQYRAEKLKEQKEQKKIKSLEKNAEIDSKSTQFSTLNSQLSTKKKATYKQQKEYEQLTAEIEALTKEKAEIEAFLSDPGQFSIFNSQFSIQEASERIGVVIAELDEKELRWLELDEIVN